MKIYLIRHAESEPRHGMGYAEAGKVNLSNFGKIQAETLAKKIDKFSIRKFFVSPLRRTKETADIINQIGAPVAYDERLAEHNISEKATGRAFKDLKIKVRADHSFKALDGESFDEAAQRFLDALNDYLKVEEGPIAIVSHALIMQAALTKIFGLEKVPDIFEASISLIERGDAGYKLKYLNRRPIGFRIILEKIRRKLKSRIN